MSLIETIERQREELQAEIDLYNESKAEFEESIRKAREAIDAVSESIKSEQDKVRLLDEQIEAYKSEQAAKLEAAKQYMSGIADDYQRDQFVDFMRTQDIYLAFESAMVASLEAAESDCRESTPEPET